MEGKTQPIGVEMQNLFWAQVKPEQWHPTFKGLWQQRNPWNECVLAEWASGFKDRDNKFVKEFQTTFNSSFWELYLFACLKHVGFTVDFNHASPDFVVTKGDDTVCIEAVIASHAEGEAPEWDKVAKLKIGETDQNQLLEAALPRIANALASKHKLYREKYSNLEHVKNKPFIIAVAPFNQPFSYMETERPMRVALYQYDIPITKPITSENRRIIIGWESQAFFKKPNGTKVDLGYFLDDRMKEVSAVIFSNIATWGKVRALSADPNPNILFGTKRLNLGGLKPHQKLVRKRDHQESLLDGLHIFVNPYATNPLPPSMFNWPDVEYRSVDEDGFPTGEPRDGNIHWRLTRTYSPDTPEAQLQEFMDKVNKYAEEELAKDLAQEAADSEPR